MELTSDEKEMLCRIANNPYIGGAYKRATWIDIICPTKADKAVLETLRHKGLAETGLGGTVAGDPYDACWLTPTGSKNHSSLIRPYSIRSMGSMRRLKCPP
jgi:hypothetical protein